VVVALAQTSELMVRVVNVLRFKIDQRNCPNLADQARILPAASMQFPAHSWLSSTWPCAWLGLIGMKRREKKLP
jgi:hypothetical protein